MFLASVLLVSTLGLAPSTHASSSRAYQDYLYQFDVYRKQYADFKVSKNEYDKFRTLTSQTTALENTRKMLAQRDLLLRSYLFLLKERLNEDRGLESTEKQIYQTLIENEVSFLETHSKLVEQIGSLEDASNTSRQLESHYGVLQTSVHQTITGISLGSLSVLTRQFDTNLADARALVSSNRGTFDPNKQATIDRWILQITNTRSLYQQKVDTIRGKTTQLRGSDPYTVTQTFRGIQKDVSEARQYLNEGTSFLRELVNTLRYQD